MNHGAAETHAGGPHEDFWSEASVARITCGRAIVRGGARAGYEAGASGLSTDTRSLVPGQAFLALRGEKHDGHDHLRAALEAGATMLIVSNARAIEQDIASGRAGVVLVPDTGAALLALGTAWRRQHPGTRVIAVAGSNGKTTTVRLIDAALGKSPAGLRGRASAKSFNNTVGVPLTLLSMRAHDQYLVCEVGTNAPGEIAPLARAASPDIAVITSVGREHLEGLGTIEGVIEEESAIVDGVARGGVVIVDEDAALVARVRERAFARGVRVVTFGLGPGTDIRVRDAEESAQGVRFSLSCEPGAPGGARGRVPLPGLHNARNAACAAAVAREFGMSVEDALLGIACATGAPMRMELSMAAGVVFLNDAYNANPESMRAALQTFAALGESTPGVARRIAVLGEMRELGSHTQTCHEEIGIAAAVVPMDLAVLVGEHMLHALAPLREMLGTDNVKHFPDAFEPNASRIAALFRPGDFVLLKGSRGVEVERVHKAYQSGHSVSTEPKAQGVPALFAEGSNA